VPFDYFLTWSSVASFTAWHHPLLLFGDVLKPGYHHIVIDGWLGKNDAAKPPA